jgi:hypothetical protein
LDPSSPAAAAAAVPALLLSGEEDDIAVSKAVTACTLGATPSERIASNTLKKRESLMMSEKETRGKKVSLFGESRQL